MDGYTTCPASAEGIAPSISSAWNNETTLKLKLCLERCGCVGCSVVDLRIYFRALARPPSQDTLQVRPCKLLCGIHAA